MCPEVAYEKDQTVAVDIWCMGILLYEMLHGKSPFKAQNLEEIKREFLCKNIMIKSSLDNRTKDLLKNLLQMNFLSRIDINSVLQHNAFNLIKGNFDVNAEEFDILTKNYLFNTTKGKKYPKEINHEKTIAENIQEFPQKSRSDSKHSQENLEPRNEGRADETRAE